MRKIYSMVFVIILAGCGYTTRGFVYPESKICIKPITNKITITRENRAYSSYTSYPILLEKKLTNAVVRKFNADGHLKVVSTEAGALVLECEVRDYRKEALRYTDSDDVEEQRLRLFVYTVLKDGNGKVNKVTTVIGDSSYYLTGSLARSESAAQEDLIEDTSRRILEAVIEEW